MMAPSPVSASEASNYVGTLHMRPITLGGATFVEWYSREDSQSEDAVEFCHGIYAALLQTLAGSFE